MKITTPNGILEGESIEAILEKYGRDCLLGANLAGAAAGVWSMIRDKRTEPTKSPTTASKTGTH